MIWTSIAQIISFRRLDSTTACSTVCFWFSSALIFWRDVLGERVERRHALLGRLAHLLELARAGRGVFSTSFTISTVVFASSWVSRDRSLSRRTSCVSWPDSDAELLELPLQALGPLGATRDLGLRLAQLLAELVERRLVLLERVEAGARLQRLRRQALQRLLCFWSSPSGAVSRTVSCSACATASARVLMRASIASSSLARASALVEPVGHLVEPGVGLPGLLLHFLQRLAGGRELGAMQLDLREHGAEGGALFSGGRNQRLQLVGLLLSGCSGALLLNASSMTVSPRG